MILRFDKRIYSREALIKAAYQFTDLSYLYLNQDDIDYIVEVTSKNGEEAPSLESDFKNEIIAQSARQIIYQQTKEIREIVMARAFASTLISSEETGVVVDNTNPVSESLDSILTDWFDKYGE